MYTNQNWNPGDLVIEDFDDFGKPIYAVDVYREKYTFYTLNAKAGHCDLHAADWYKWMEWNFGEYK